jgi:hypothetical protein
VGFLKPRPKLTFGWVQDCHSYLDSATPAEGFLNFPLALCGNPPICVKPDFLPHSNPYTTLIFVRDSFQQLLRGYISGKWEVGNTEQKADG